MRRCENGISVKIPGDQWEIQSDCGEIQGNLGEIQRNLVWKVQGIYSEELQVKI
jgi:hypothetical protein